MDNKTNIFKQANIDVHLRKLMSYAIISNITKTIYDRNRQTHESRLSIANTIKKFDNGFFSTMSAEQMVDISSDDVVESIRDMLTRITTHHLFDISIDDTNNIYIKVENRRQLSTRITKIESTSSRFYMFGNIFSVYKDNLFRNLEMDKKSKVFIETRSKFDEICNAFSTFSMGGGFVMVDVYAYIQCINSWSERMEFFKNELLEVVKALDLKLIEVNNDETKSPTHSIRSNGINRTTTNTVQFHSTPTTFQDIINHQFISGRNLRQF